MQFPRVLLAFKKNMEKKIKFRPQKKKSALAGNAYLAVKQRGDHLNEIYFLGSKIKLIMRENKGGHYSFFSIFLDFPN